MLHRPVEKLSVLCTSAADLLMEARNSCAVACNILEPEAQHGKGRNPSLPASGQKQIPAWLVTTLGVLLFLIFSVDMFPICPHDHARLMVERSHRPSSDMPRLSTPSRKPLDCATFDPSRIKLVTFDVFAALMDLPASLKKHVAEAIPELSMHEVDKLSETMMAGYGSYMGHAFTPKETGGLQPFVWMARATLSKAIADLGLSVRIPIGSPEFDHVLGAWSDLIPRNGTGEALANLAPHFMFAPLSNGDRGTLVKAAQVFSPKIKMSSIFSSDFPVGVFKPLAPIYAQVEEVAGLEPDEVLHVAGSGFDARGAREYGLYAALSYSEPEKEGSQPCFVLKHIQELLPILELS